MIITINWETASENITLIVIKDAPDNETTYTMFKLNSKIISLQFWIQHLKGRTYPVALAIACSNIMPIVRLVVLSSADSA